VKKYSKLLVLVLILSIVLTGCGGEEDATNKSGKAGSNEQGMPTEEVTLKFAYFDGGFGGEWAEWLKTEFENKYPNVTVELTGDANLLETLTPMIESGVDAPDVFMNLGSKWETWGPQGLVMDLTDLYEREVPGTGMTLNEYMTDAAKDKFFFDLGTDDSEVKKYAIPWTAGPMSIVYNVNMFEEHGWEYPETWGEFEELCETIKAEGIAPITYPGKYPNYMRPLIRSWQIQSMGPEKFLGEYKNPTSPEIYGDPAILESFTKFKELFDKGWIMKGTTGLDHTQVQMEFINNKVAMILNGSWLEQEMQEVWPEGYKIALGPIPQAGKIDKPTAFLSVGGDYLAIYGDTKVPEVAKEFLLFSVTPEANRAFLEISGGLRPFKFDFDDVEVSDFIKSCQDIVSNPDYFQFTDSGSNPLMYQPLGNDLLNEIATGETTPEEAAKTFLKEAETEYNNAKKDLGL
jgi:N-acetylglucosamine transport system substrate-binding protein